MFPKMQEQIGTLTGPVAVKNFAALNGIGQPDISNGEHMVVEIAQDAENEVRHRIAQVLETVVTEMTSPKAGVEVSFASGEKTTTYKVVLAQEFRGKLIGSQGKNITSLRNIVGAMAGNNGFRAIIELVI